MSDSQLSDSVTIDLTPAAPPLGPFPVSTLTRRKTLLEPDTTWDLVISRFSDRILVVLTTLNKPGTLFQVTQATPSGASTLSPGASPIYDVQLLLGAETPRLTAVAQIIAAIFESQAKPVLVSLGFKDLDIGTFRSEILPWIQEQISN
ncbi:hypothetical protein TCAL_08468 [Tigriopus californicus]|uniref:Uncharacterized protein n=1 Tax=Tigriopus californicus TaxID=6832 RepID=A0A553N918_TIGCA|nr:hypothetical protein TCAL_08468 [Tigriopus californicus]|eukprot:TCALIF_08468-PA protein Name:"Protein of unknown function" AED:0.49 eAED:0.52 QI:0/-1/0/1/-1/1/1/0/147